VTQPNSTMPLHERAALAFPDSEYLQTEWIRAVALVRQTKRGWVADLRQPANAGGRPVPCDHTFELLARMGA